MHGAPTPFLGIRVKNKQMNSAQARAPARATSEQLGADGHVVNEDGDLMLLMAERHGLKDVCRCGLKRLRSVARSHGKRIPQVLPLGYCERK